ncbi:DHA2 family efflux MFS transporter permease subunit [Vibrio nitrifigilis]|uniref:DHA2 family efflux MFS transporter permease subunit n=1 Tax=Vibrio nitrifigilis TaxID=2789781 RepID=A0ABS0GDB4_9VIBR|nr:DHA2 family efflux MFS transporter permease subunit [Vibrio nitrifigilis]MBF9000394.1 DHA2 family efflux MFS transporter permease subunit [Vibrio nitrifigilis]
MLKIDRRTATSLLVAGTMFMEILDSTVITTALPVIAKDFGTAAAHLSLGVSAYLVALTIFIPISGWAADRFGPRRIFSAAIIIFTLSSLLCSLCTDLTQFTLARILQGLGGAMMVPVGRLVVLRHTPKNRLVQAIAILTWPALFAPLIGPVVGGWIATHWSWHWIFLLNLPLGAIALIATLMLVDNHSEPVQRFDTRGFILSGLGFGILMAGLEACSRDDVSLNMSLSLLAGGFILLVMTTVYLLRSSHPLFNLSPLRIKTFRISIVGGSLFRIAINTAPFLLPLLFQIGMGYSPIQSGTLLLWLFAGNLFIKPATTWIMNQFGFKNVLIINGLMVAAGFAAMSQMTANTPYLVIVAILFISGMNRSIQFTALNTISFADMPDKKMRDANTLQAVFLQMNIGTGIALGALFLSIACLLHGHTSTNPVTEDFSLALWFTSALALIAIIDSLLLSPRAGFSVLEKKSQVCKQNN